MKNMDKGLIHCTKMGADGLAENIPNAPEFICPICLLKFWISIKKASLGICIVRVITYRLTNKNDNSICHADMVFKFFPRS